MVSVPPFQGDSWATPHASICFTGSHATKRPKGFALGSVALRMKPRFQPDALCKRPGALAFMRQSLSGVRVSGTPWTGM